jgi:hypothetical protein
MKVNRQLCCAFWFCKCCQGDLKPTYQIVSTTEDDVVTSTGLSRMLTEIDLTKITVKFLGICRVQLDYHYPTLATHRPSSQTFVKPLFHTQVRVR